MHKRKHLPLIKHLNSDGDENQLQTLNMILLTCLEEITWTHGFHNDMMCPHTHTVVDHWTSTCNA